MYSSISNECPTVNGSPGNRYRIYYIRINLITTHLNIYNVQNHKATNQTPLCYFILYTVVYLPTYYSNVVVTERFFESCLLHSSSSSIYKALKKKK